MGKTLTELHKSGTLASAASTSVLEMKPKPVTRRYTFSVLELDPVSPKTPALVGDGWRSSDRQGRQADFLVSVPAMLDNSFITLQSRMDPVQSALREDCDAFDPIEHRMEYDLLNSVYKTVQNIAYHLNKLVRSLSAKDSKYARPENGMDGLDIVSGLRASVTRSQEACKRLTQLVKNHKNMYGQESTKDVLGDEGMLVLEQIEGAMMMALNKSARLVDAMDAAKKGRAKVLQQKVVAAFFQVQGDKGETSAVLRVHFVAWKDALATLKEERAAPAMAPAA